MNSGHFLLVPRCISLIEDSEHISSGKRAFPSVASTSIVEAVLLLILSSLIWICYQIAHVPLPSLSVKKERFFI